MDALPFVEFGASSNFSFLEGASHPEEMARQALGLGLSGLGLADRNTVAGVVRAHAMAKEEGLRYHPGARLCFADDTPDMLAYPADREGWAGLCRLLSQGNLRSEKGRCTLFEEDLKSHARQMALILLPVPEEIEAPGFPAFLLRFRDLFGGWAHLGLTPRYDGCDRRIWQAAITAAKAAGVPLIATNQPLCHEAERRPLADVLTAIRHHVPVQEAGFLLRPNDERHLKDAREMTRLFRLCPEAVTNTLALSRRLTFTLDELKHEYPDESQPGESLPETLSRLAREGARRRYPRGVPEKVLGQIDHELAMIRELQYEPYFLTVYDIVRYARSQGILCQGRGSAANSTVCFCLGITEVDPAMTDLLFERFISPERREPPDIDVDFEHERREDVIQYIYRKYGRAHAGLAATVTTYRARMAGREVAKAFGLSEDVQSALSGSIWGWSNNDLSDREAKAAGLDVADPLTQRVLGYASLLMGFPRHLGQHVGGFVITRSRLDEVVPIMNTAMEGRTMVEWDKDDLDQLGILKIDILALGMLSCLRRGLDMLALHYDRRLSLATIPKEQDNVYDMIVRADTIGVFQIESRAQMSMLPRLKPRCFYDLVIEVAIVRPGPIQGDMVHPYLRRRQNREQVTYPKEELRAVLGRTLGVPLFQEQAMKIAIVAAGFTPTEADKLRRAMATFRRVGTIHSFRMKMVEGMVKRGYDADFADRCFRQIEGFGEYGFPESHAASFALLVYASCWMKAWYPDVFCAALLNSQPMGFYAPAQIVRDARDHGVEVRPVDVNHSFFDATLEETRFDPRRIAWRHREMAGVIRTERAVRLGFRQIKGLSQEHMEELIAARDGGYRSVRDLWLRTGIPRAAIEKLADADAFRSLGIDRRTALWEVRALDEKSAAEHLPLFEGLFGRGDAELQPEPKVAVPALSAGEAVVQDYRSLSLSLDAHPVQFVRAELERDRVLPASALERLPQGRMVSVAGLVLVRQRPGSAKGVIFMTLEDETASANIIVWPKVFSVYRPVVLGSRLVEVRGRLQKADGVIHVVAASLVDRTPMLAALARGEAAFDTLARADEVKRPVEEQRLKKHPASQARALFQEMPELAADVRRVMPKGRNFH
ncbi:error-prone DNA polymerase [Gellertiella hungarica]|uniref:Error-prone DNA polymerase n=1 Tax=Gellertiella hungarica TaxID=1572859 RepID=A0A7W6J7U5_9HYPH|nr:error-prone DNA polymerase [Gellertiella hungarica]MBB4065466.1 DNA-directed DNA polymerase III PolC [Gellertiella hungarica]